MKALLLVDIQNDFLKGGALEVPEGNEIIPVVNRLIPEFDLVIATQDWHPPNHLSFASNHPGKNAFDMIQLNGIDQVLWPDHCIQGSGGADFHSELQTNRIEAIIRKGMSPAIDSYSGFYDNGHLKSTGLSGYLRERGVTDLVICGLAADYCVYYTLLDASSEGFRTILVEDATRAISVTDFEDKKKTLIIRGITLSQASDIKH